MGGFGAVKGPANIKAFMEKNMGTGGNAAKNYHLLSNFVITVNGDTATAWSRWAFVQPRRERRGHRAGGPLRRHVRARERRVEVQAPRGVERHGPSRRGSGRLPRVKPQPAK